MAHLGPANSGISLIGLGGQARYSSDRPSLRRFTVQHAFPEASSDPHAPRRYAALWRHLQPWRGWLAAALALGCMGAAAGAIEPLFYRSLLDLMVAYQPAAHAFRMEPQQWRAALAAVGGLVGLGLGQQLIQTLQTLTTNRARFDSSFALSRRLLAHLYHQPLGFHQESGAGYLITRMDRGVAALGELAGDVLQSLAPNLANLAMIAFLLVRLSPSLALVALAPLPLFLLAAVRSTQHTVAAEEEVQESWSRVYRRVSEVLGAIKTIKAMGRETAETKLYEEAAKGVFHRLWRLVRIDAGYQNARSFLALVGRAAVLLDGMHLVLQGKLTPGSWMAAVTYAGMIYAPLASLAGAWSAGARALVSASAVFDFLEHNPGVDDVPGAITLPRLRGTVEFEDVHYAYPVWEENGRLSSRQHAPVLRGISFRAEPGEVIALVGPSGGGKTTLIDLLLRFYDPQRGSVRMDGYDLRTVTQPSLRSQVSVVLQDPVLLQGTVAENIAYGVPGASLDEIRAAARAACADEFICALPQGYQTRVGERGASLSGGQKQRIAIARALLLDPRILVLDEATSQLDADSEASVYAALRRLMQGRTTFVIAHRISAMLPPDRVLVLAHGQIVESGTPEELIRTDGLFAHWVQETGGREVPRVLQGAAAARYECLKEPGSLSLAPR